MASPVIGVPRSISDQSEYGLSDKIHHYKASLQAKFYLGPVGTAAGPAWQPAGDQISNTSELFDIWATIPLNTE